MKKLLSLILVGVLALALCACGGATTATEENAANSGDEAAASSSGKQLKFGICAASLTNEYFVEFTEGAKAWCEENGIEAITKDANDDISKQVTAIEDFINAGCDAIIINALDDDALRPAVKNAVEQGIPVIAESVNVEGCTAAVIIDEHDYGYALGQTAGKWAEEHFSGQKVEYAVLTQSTLSVCIERANGIIEGVQAECPTAECVFQEDAYTPDKGVTVGENIMNAYPEIKMILGINDAGALGAYEAVVGAGVDEKDTDNFFVGGTDGDSQAMEKVDNGLIYQCTVALSDPNQVVGANAAKAAYEAIQNGGKVDTVWLGFAPYVKQ